MLRPVLGVYMLRPVLKIDLLEVYFFHSSVSYGGNMMKKRNRV